MSVRAARATLAADMQLRSLPWLVFALASSSFGAWAIGQAPPGEFPWLGATCHTLGAVATGWGIATALGPGETARHGWALFLGTFALLAGPVGVIFAVVSYLLARGQPTRLPLTEVVKAEMFVTEVPDCEPEELLPLDLKVREHAQIEPFVDLLPVADVATAIAMVNRLKERGQRADVEMIRRLTADPRPEVYQYALAVLDKLERGFAARFFELAQQSQENPRGLGPKLELARLHLEYIQSGLLDDLLEEYYWEIALGHLFEALLARPQHPELGADLAQVLALRGLVREAGQVATVVVRRQPSLLQAQLLILESLYQQALESQDPGLLLSAKRTALESAWAVSLPSTRSRDGGSTYDLAHFWFGDRDA